MRRTRTPATAPPIMAGLLDPEFESGLALGRAGLVDVELVVGVGGVAVGVEVLDVEGVEVT